jgi:hypothetical protein
VIVISKSFTGQHLSKLPGEGITLRFRQESSDFDPLSVKAQE